MDRDEAVASAMRALTSRSREFQSGSVAFLAGVADEAIGIWIAELWARRANVADVRQLQEQDFLLESLAKADPDVLRKVTTHVLATESNLSKRNWFVFALSQASPSFAVPTLRDIVAGNYEPTLRRQALIALAHLKGERAEQAIVELLRNARSSAEAMLVMNEGVRHLPPQAVPASELWAMYRRTEAAGLKMAIARELARAGGLTERDVTDLRRAALEGLRAEEDAVRDNAIDTLVAIAPISPHGVQDLMILAEGLAHNSVSRSIIIEALSEAGHDGGVMRLMQRVVVDDASPSRSHAYKYIARVGTEEDQRALIERVLNVASLESSKSIIDTFARYGSDRAIELLRSRLKNDAPQDVRTMADEILARHGRK